MDNLVEVYAIAQPAAFVNMVAYTRGYEFPLVCIVAINQKFCHRIAHRRLLDVLAERPPTEVPHFLEVLVGTIEKGHVLRHPLPCFCVRNGLHNILILHRVKIVDVVLVVVVL